ncbi:unnamed protein product [Sympodiomycopsis kandeliae]
MDSVQDSGVPAEGMSSAARPRKRFTKEDVPGQQAGPSVSPGTAKMGGNSIPADILEDEALNTAIAAILPPNYNFEIHKTIHHVRKNEATCVALQMPEGLTLWATGIADLIERFTEATTVIMGDVTYGACCVDDYTAMALGCDMLVHYGHSCLIPVDQTQIKTLYVFVEISIDPSHLAATVRANFPDEKAQFRARILSGAVKGKQRQEQAGLPEDKNTTSAPLSIGIERSAEGQTPDPSDQTSKPTHLALVGTVQFINAIQGLRDNLEERVQVTGDTVDPSGRLMLTSGTETDLELLTISETAYAAPRPSTGTYSITVPQVKPLSPGEVLGCTSPRLSSDVDAIIYVGDGRFHLESIMIANPRIPAFRYDPYTKRFVRELYDHAAMRQMRGDAVRQAEASMSSAPAPRATNSNGSHEVNKNGSQEVGSSPAAWGIVLGTLGRQGSLGVLNHLRSSLTSHSPPVPHVPILLSELSPAKLSLFGEHLQAYIQTSCPRLSIDWGSAFPKPLLSPYEAAVALGKSSKWEEQVNGLGMKRDPAKQEQEEQRQDFNGGDYPMDFYANDSLGPWTPRHGMGPKKRVGGMSNRALLQKLQQKGKDKKLATPMAV